MVESGLFRSGIIHQRSRAGQFRFGSGLQRHMSAGHPSVLDQKESAADTGRHQPRCLQPRTQRCGRVDFRAEQISVRSASRGQMNQEIIQCPPHSGSFKAKQIQRSSVQGRRRRGLAADLNKQPVSPALASETPAARCGAGPAGRFLLQHPLADRTVAGWREIETLHQGLTTTGPPCST